MIKLYGVSDNHCVVAKELAEIKEKYEEELRNKESGWLEMFSVQRIAHRMALGVTLQARQQLIVANYFI